MFLFLFISCDQKSNKNVLKKIQYIVDGINMNCPQRASHDVIWNGVVNTSNSQEYEITYIYTHTNASAKDVIINKQLKKVAINMIRSSPEANFYKRNKVNFGFFYLDRDGNYIDKIEVSAGDYCHNNE